MLSVTERAELFDRGGRPTLSRILVECGGLSFTSSSFGSFCYKTLEKTSDLDRHERPM